MQFRKPSRLLENLIVVIIFAVIVIYLVLSASGTTPFIYAGF